MPSLHFHDDPASFLAEAGDHLAADPVTSTVLATVSGRAAADDAAGVARDPAQPFRWWLVVREGREVVGVGMRTAPFEPYPLFLLPMPDQAARALARELHDRGEDVGGVNGARPAVDVCAAELATLSGGGVREGMHTRLHRLDRVLPPAPTTGSSRVASVDDLDLVVAWFEAFGAAADEQAGRPPGSMHPVAVRPEALRQQVEQGLVWLWVEADGTPVSLVAAHPPAYGVARVAPVYTPDRHRRRGYAGNLVAALSQRILDAGAVACLYTDQANPASNQLYAALGYRPVVDMVDLVVAPAGS